MPDVDEINPNRLLAIDDDGAILEVIKDVAEQRGYAVQCVGNATEFREALASFQPTLIFIDLIMPDTDGISLLRELADNRSSARIVLISGLDNSVLARARKLGDDQGLTMLAVLTKPIRIEQLEDRLTQGRSDPD